MGNESKCLDSFIEKALVHPSTDIRYGMIFLKNK